MSTQLVIQQVAKLAEQLSIPASDDLIQVLKSTAFRGQVSDAQMAALLVVAGNYGLNPWTKEIYAFPDQNNGIVPVVGVDGWSRIINSHPQFDGMDFEQDDESCTCIMYRKDRSHPVRVTEYMSECKRGVKPWQSHPKRMLRHKAMIQCARLAFGYVGIFDLDEAERIIEVNPAPTRPTRRTAADIAEATTVEFTAEHADILAHLEEVADTGRASLETAWGAITEEQRTALIPNMRQLKQRADAADQKTQGDEDA